MKRVFWRIAFLGVIVLLGAGCARIETVSEEEMSDRIRQSVSKATAEKRPSFCKQLPVNAVVYWSFPHDLTKRYHTIAPRNKCLWDYMESTHDISACSLIDDKTGGFAARYKCFTYLAETFSKPAYCDDIDEQPLRMRCEALTKLSTEECYRIEKDEHDASRYARAIMWCIGEVVYRTKSEAPCLKIDGPDYGEQWRIGRNGCLLQVATYRHNKKEPTQLVCDLMVEGEPEYSDDRQDCYAKEFPHYAIEIPKRIKNLQ